MKNKKRGVGENWEDEEQEEGSWRELGDEEQEEGSWRSKNSSETSRRFGKQLRRAPKPVFEPLVLGHPAENFPSEFSVRKVSAGNFSAGKSFHLKFWRKIGCPS